MQICLLPLPMALFLLPMGSPARITSRSAQRTLNIRFNASYDIYRYTYRHLHIACYLLVTRRESRAGVRSAFLIFAIDSMTLLNNHFVDSLSQKVWLKKK